MEAIVGILECVAKPATEMAKCFAEPIKLHFEYLFFLRSKIKNLEGEARKLKDKRDGLQGRVDRARDNAEEIIPEVKTWLEKTNEVLGLANMVQIESESTDIESGWLTVKSRFSLSEKVKKTTEAMEQLLGDCNFDPISRPAPPASIVPIPLGTTYEFESRRHIEKDIMATLRDKNVNMIGICGMGGVGKTTMAKKVMNRVREENLFDEVAIAVVSQQVDMLKIQLEIAEQLGLEFKEETLSARAHKLRTRLEGGKRILIVLDDIWRYLKWEDLGIACENGLKGCTILLTSRDRDVFNRMDVQKICEIQTLAEIEAWSLFREKVGTCVDDENLLSVAQEVVKECKGLPIALVTVGMALKNKRNKSIWEDALQQLKSSNPTTLSSVLAEVYNPLKLSYDFLDNEQARSMFLLCSLFPEDHSIPLEDLTVYAMGLRMFDDINFGLVRNRTCSLVEMLKSRFLLLEGWDGYRVRMHDVVRDVAIFIASEERRIKCIDCTWISPYLREENELSTESIFPNLRLLLIDRLPDKNLQINDCSFEGMTKLNVLSIKFDSLRSLPQSPQKLKSLRTLILHSCKSLETMSVVGELVNLEVLICHHCDLIKELPVEIRRLERMRLLDLSYCEELKTIAPDIISRLVRLEKLKIVASFNKWEAKDNEGKERKNVGLRELEYLSNLASLEIEVKDFALVAEEICLSQKIVNFGITIGDHELFEFPLYNGLEKRINLHLPRDITLGNWILKFLRDFEHMRLVGEGLISNLELEHQALQNLRSLALIECSMVKKLGNNIFPHLESLKLEELANLEVICDIDGPVPDEGSTHNIAFKNLKVLRLVNLPTLKHLWKSANQNNVVSLFNNLSSIYLDGCDNLCGLFSLSTTKDSLSQLKRLEISFCMKMEKVFLWNEEENEKNSIGTEIHYGRHIKVFPKLEELILRDLPRLTTFCKGIESIKFPLLTEVRINKCPKLKSVVSTACSIRCGNNQNNSKGNSHDHDDDDDSLHFFCKSEEALQNLRRLTLRECSTVRNLGNTVFPLLEDLDLFNLPNLEEICNIDGLIPDEGSTSNNIAFKNLEHLFVGDLPRLKHFWKSSYLNNVVSLFNNLSSISLKSCNSLRNLFLLSISAKDCLLQLKRLYISFCKRMEQVFVWNEENEKNIRPESCCRHHTKIFPKLEELTLQDLPRLRTFCKGIESIKFPLLTEIRIRGCPKLKSVVSTTCSIGCGNNQSNSEGNNHDHDDDDDSLHLFCKPEKVAFDKVIRVLDISETTTLWCHHIPISFFIGLEDLEISSCNKIKSLFSLSIVENLVNLKKLSIQFCNEMVKVIDDKGEKDTCPQTTTCLFPSLEFLQLSWLFKLEMFCGWRSCALELPSLKTVQIDDCPKMERFSFASLTTPKLEEIRTPETSWRMGSARLLMPEIIIKSKDLNDAAQKLLFEGKEREERWRKKIEENRRGNN